MGAGLVAQGLVSTRYVGRIVNPSYVGGEWLALVGQGLVSTCIRGGDLGPGKIDCLRGVGLHRLDRWAF